jgi:hypothetical protein
MPETDSAILPAFLATDDYVPGAFRDLLSEAEGCLQKGFLTGGTACGRRTLDLLLMVAKAEGATYEDRLQSLGEKHGISKMLTSILVQCGGASARDNATLSTEVLQLFIVTMKAVVYELYVVGPERTQRLQYVSRLVTSVGRKPAADSGSEADTSDADELLNRRPENIEERYTGAMHAAAAEPPTERGRGYRRAAAASTSR